jgi:hypothetical protein
MINALLCWCSTLFLFLAVYFSVRRRSPDRAVRRTLVGLAPSWPIGHTLPS